MCLGLHNAKNSMVRTAADMTVRQIISLLFDRVAEELGVTPNEAANAPAAALSNSDANNNATSGTGGATKEAGKDRNGAVRGVASKAGEGIGKEGGGATGEGALRCAHLVFQARRLEGGGGGKGAGEFGPLTVCFFRWWRCSVEGLAAAVSRVSSSGCHITAVVEAQRPAHGVLRVLLFSGAWGVVVYGGDVACMDATIVRPPKSVFCCCWNYSPKRSALPTPDSIAYSPGFGLWWEGVWHGPYQALVLLKQ